MIDKVAMEQAQAELAQQHPELRIELFPSQTVHEQNRSRLTDSAGAYEWWSVCGLDTRGNGIICEFHLGHAFDPRYRSAYRRFRAGQNIDLPDLRPASYPALRLTVLKRGAPLARAVCGFGPNSWREAEGAAHQAWSVSIGSNRLAASGEGWLLSINVPAQRMGYKAVFRPEVESDARIRGEFDIQPCYETILLSRAGFPDSPGGLQHNWLIAAPSAFITGHVELLQSSAKTPRDKTPGAGHSSRVKLHKAIGAVEHFWGRSLPGDTFRRRYGARISSKECAAIGDLIIIRKYIQLAPTLMIFRPGALPDIIRCDRGPRSAFQRSKWFIGYPLEMLWAHEHYTPVMPAGTTLKSGGPGVASVGGGGGGSGRVRMTHRLDQLNDASPCQAVSATIAELQLPGRAGAGEDGAGADRSPHSGLIEGQGIVSLIAPARAGSVLWRRWCRPVHDTSTTV